MAKTCIVDVSRETSDLPINAGLEEGFYYLITEKSTKHHGKPVVCCDGKIRLLEDISVSWTVERCEEWNWAVKGIPKGDSINLTF